jgi:hypothetical protein
MKGVAFVSVAAQDKRSIVQMQRNKQDVARSSSFAHEQSE